MSKNATHEWDTLGDTISHMASLPNAAPGVQQGFKDGYKDANDVFVHLAPDQWVDFPRILNEYIDGIHRLAVVGEVTEEFASAYVAALRSLITLTEVSDPQRRYRNAR